MKCLVTQLNEAVENNDLMFFNALRYKVKTMGRLDYYAKYSSASFQKARIINGVFADENDVSLGTEVSGASYNKTRKIILDEGQEYAIVILENKDKLTSLDQANLFPGGVFSQMNTEEFANISLTGANLSVRGLVGDIANLANIAVREINNYPNVAGSAEAQLYGDMSLLNASVAHLPTPITKVCSFTAGNRSDSNNNAFSCLNSTWRSPQDFENFLVAQAKCAWNPDVRNSSYIKAIATDFPASQVTQLMKEACWYLHNKMYANLGDVTRTEGTYFTIPYIDFSDITEDPGWID